MGFMMELRMAAAPAMRQILRCGVCKQSIDGEEVKNTAILEQLLGSKRYAVCVGCGQEVTPPWDKAYKARFRRREMAIAKGQP